MVAILSGFLIGRGFHSSARSVTLSQSEIVETKQVYELFITYIRAGENTIGKNTYFYAIE